MENYIWFSVFFFPLSPHPRKKKALRDHWTTNRKWTLLKSNWNQWQRLWPEPTKHRLCWYCDILPLSWPALALALFFFPHTADREWAQKSPRENRSHAWENSPAPAARLLELHRLATCLPPMIILYTPFIIILPTLFLSLPQTVRDSWSAAHAERLTDRLLVNIFKILRFSLPPELAMGIYAPLLDLNLPAKRILNTNSNF